MRFYSACDNGEMAKHIGIVACSAEGAALCYRTICEEGDRRLGNYHHPEITMHTHSLGEYMEFVDRDDWQGVAGLVLSSAHKLAKAGADFLICPDNTLHLAFPIFAPKSPLPWLHIAEEVAAQARQKGFRKLAITGTRYTMKGPAYPQKLAEVGIESLSPNEDEQGRIHQIIFEELVRGIFTGESRSDFQRIINRMMDEGCDAVVLGCTEIPLLIDDTSSPLPTLDSTRILARAALVRALD
jgi:aspartate racemase